MISLGLQRHECDQKGLLLQSEVSWYFEEAPSEYHEVDVVFYPCNQEGCDYKTKQGSNVKRQLADNYDIGVKWDECDQKDCSNKAKQAWYFEDAPTRTKRALMAFEKVR